MPETVLVVDDEPDILAVVRSILEQKGYTVLHTGDPHQALRWATQREVNLLLTDVIMPLMKGTELAQRFQALSPDTKVILMSAYKVAEITASGLPFIAKPFVPDALVERVRHALAPPSSFGKKPQPPGGR
ncbi:MAG TPA: response regulator [Methylomirabilota bacterium]|nr:response regulator [Methylomirabilota bacterium]